jgi:predicted metal-dependent peptidase
LEKPYIHPDFPELSIQQLKEKADNFSIDDHLISFCFQEPFWADIIRYLNKRVDYSIPTAGVSWEGDTISFIWNPLWVAAYPTNKIMGILRHECSHLVLGHCTSRQYKPRDIWNISADLAINSEIPKDDLCDCGFKPGYPLKKPYNYDDMTPEQQMSFALSSDLIKSLKEGLSLEEYFSILMSDPNFRENTPSKGGDEHDDWELDHGDSGDLTGDSEEYREYRESKLRQIVKKAQEKADRQNSWGSISASMREKIRIWANGEINWKALLRSFVLRAHRADRLSSIFRPNKKYLGVHSGHSRDYVPRINCYIDQSGSMSDDDIALCFSELISLSRVTTITVYHFDTDVDESSKQVWRGGMGFPKTLRTKSGGTSFDDVTRHAMKDKPDGYIILTDGGSTKPPPSRIRRAWVLIPGCELEFKNIDSGDILIKMKKGRQMN